MREGAGWGEEVRVCFGCTAFGLAGGHPGKAVRQAGSLALGGIV